MKNRQTLIWSIIVVLLLAFTAFWFIGHRAPTLEAVPASVTASGANFIVRNRSMHTISYCDYHFRIQQLVDGNWESIPSQVRFPAHIRNPLRLFERQTFEINWESIYGQLPPGEYRLSIMVYGIRSPFSISRIPGAMRIYAPFVVEETP